MRGRVNLPPDAVISLVQAVKSRQKELRDHSKLDTDSGWTVRNQAWKTIRDELNVRFGRELTVEQCAKKFLNIKTMIKYKMEEQARKRQQPGFENFLIRLTPAEQEYMRLFRGVSRPSAGGSKSQFEHGQRAGESQTMIEMKEEEGEEIEEGPLPTVAMFLGEEDSFGDDSFERTGSVTEALLGMIPDGTTQDPLADGGQSPQPLAMGLPSKQKVGPLLNNSAAEQLHCGSSQTIGQFHFKGNSAHQQPLEGGGKGWPGQSEDVNGGHRIGQKRKLASAGKEFLEAIDAVDGNGNEWLQGTSGTGQKNAEEEEAGRRLKRLKCELVEMQKLELMRREEWRLKKEFMLGRQTVAMENVVLLLREIRGKSE